MTVSDIGPAPLQFGAATVTGAPSAGLSVGQDTCPAVLEPDQTCTVSVHSAPLTAGPIAGQLEVPTDNGPLDVPVTAVVASVSALQPTQLPVLVFTVSPAGDGVGSPQSLLLALSNPLSAAVSVAYVDLSGPDANRFHLVADRCRGTPLPPGRRARSPLWSHPSGVAPSRRAGRQVGRGARAPPAGRHPAQRLVGQRARVRPAQWSPAR